MTIHIVAVLEAKLGQETPLHDALLALVPLVRQEPGCLEYTPHVSVDRDSVPAVWG
jgi:quinol monooxygenase YgiN